VAALAVPAAARAEFPYAAQGGGGDYGSYRLPDSGGASPSDLRGKLEWMYAATPEPGNEPVNRQPEEHFGIRGARLVDRADVDVAWRTTTGRPDVAIAVLDSGIKWNDYGAMVDLRRKTRLWQPELPVPRRDRAAPSEAGVDCSRYRDAYDANGDGVFDVVDYACDARVDPDPERGVGPTFPDDHPTSAGRPMLDPQDVLIAFSDGSDADGNGFVDDIVGWDFLDDDNDPYDDVQYGHGTGEARDSSAEADNGGELGTCPNCMAVHMRVGDSFIADSADFGQAVLYAVDNDVLVIQEALGTLNNTSLGRDAVEYAYRHGVATIASAADEAAQHHNWPSNYEHTIVVNSVTKYDPTFTPVPRSYLQFNGCTNFSSKISVAIPSVSCSSDATGRASGMAGLIYSAALNAIEAGELDPHPRCRRADGSRCPLSANEVRQLMASGAVGGTPLPDDVDFAADPEPSCHPVPLPHCTDPNLNAPGNRVAFSPLATTRRYPARGGHDQFYGYGRINMLRSVEAARAGQVPPEAELASPEWYAQVDPARPTLAIAGEVGARSGTYTCRVEVAPGSQPNDRSTDASPPGDFERVPSPVCDGGERSEPFSGVLAQLDVRALKRRFPASAGDFRGREPGALGVQHHGGRPNVDPYSFTVRVVVEQAGEPALRGEDRRNLFLHRDRDLLLGFPLQHEADVEPSPLLADLDGDNRNELVVATADGTVHAYRRNRSEAPGWPVRGDALPLHTGQRAFRAGGLDADRYRGAFLGSPAVGDLDRDGSPEVVAADYEGRVYVWNARGERVRTLRANPDWSGRPLEPFANEREGKRNRTQHGFIASPVLADVDGDDGGRLEVVAAAMDRHLYVWNDDGSTAAGFPLLVVDPDKVESIDPRSHQVRFNERAGDPLNQGAIVATPAVGDLTGDGRPEIVVGTNEEYAIDAPGEGGFAVGNLNTFSMALLGQSGLLNLANGRIYAVEPSGDGDGDGDPRSGSPFVDGWPVKVGLVFAEILPIVGEGITGAPVIGPVACPRGGNGTKVGAIPDAGPAYVFNADGTSCYGDDPANGQPIALASDVAAHAPKYDEPVLPAVGNPAFGRFAGGVSFLAPAAGVIRALDLAVNEYQGGQDYVAVWDPATGQFRPNFPQQVNDLQFLTGPSVADVDGRPGEELLAGTASMDLHAFSGDGREASAAWPKLTSDWVVASPLVGVFGERATAGGTRKVVIAATRDGRLFAYGTDAPACSPGSWPRYHHDNANSGDFARDAVPPGTPERVRLEGGELSFDAPGDDGLCGAAASYEVVAATSRARLARRLRRRGAARALEPLDGGAGAGRRTRLDLAAPRGARWVAVRALDDAGNPGRAAVVGLPRR
jgi:hypothetical protein